MSLNESSLYRCSTVFDGGALCVTSGSHAVLRSASLAANAADTGAGMFVDSLSSAEVHGSVFRSNEGQTFGGALFVSRLASVSLATTLIAGTPPPFQCVLG